MTNPATSNKKYALVEKYDIMRNSVPFVNYNEHHGIVSHKKNVTVTQLDYVAGAQFAPLYGDASEVKVTGETAIFLCRKLGTKVMAWVDADTIEQLDLTTARVLFRAGKLERVWTFVKKI